MIEIPFWIFIMLLIGFSLFITFSFISFVLIIHDKIIDFLKWKTNYNKYKEFWEENEDLR